jgi:hypothetical protein
MKAQNAGANNIVVPEVIRQVTVRKVLLICGILYFPLYLAGHILAGMQLEGYSHIDQQVSELSAIGASTRPMLTAFLPIYLVLAVAFGMGVWGAAGKKRSLRVAAIALVAFGVIGFVGWLAPMNPPGAERSATDIAHLVFIFATVLSMMLFVGFGSGADGRWFRIYSIVTILVTLVAGAWTGSQASKIGAGVPTPWLGAIERVSVYSPLLWMLVLAVVLLRAQQDSPEVEI